MRAQKSSFNFIDFHLQPVFIIVITDPNELRHRGKKLAQPGFFSLMVAGFVIKTINMVANITYNKQACKLDQRSVKINIMFNVVFLPIGIFVKNIRWQVKE